MASSNQRFQRLVEDMKGVVFYEHGPDHRFTYLSPFAEELYGYPVEELLGQPFDVLHPGDPSDETVHELTCLAFREHRATGGYTAVNQRKDGRLIYVEIVETPVVENGVVVAVQGVARDVTARVRAQRALHESEQRLRAIQKMDAVSRLAGGIAHEFNNLLTTITGHVEHLLEDLSSHADAQAQLRGIRHASEKAGTLTRQILDVGRTQIAQPRTLDLNELLGETEELLRRLVGEPVTLKKALDPELPPVRVDPEQMEQLVVDLALNARDAMPKGGTLTLNTGTVAFSVTDAPADISAGRYVTLDIADTGVGIPNELQDQIFEPFFTTKESGEGTGLGLATVYGIARQAGGGVAITSAPGEGTRVRIYLPEADDDREAPGDRSEPLLSRPSAHQRGTILVAGNDLRTRRILRRILEAAGHTVLEAEGTENALGLADRASNGIDLFMAPVTMPGRSGLTLARTLQARMGHLPVILLTEPGEEDMAVKHILQQGIPFLPTPVVPGEVLRRVDQLLADTGANARVSE